ncbi:MAG: hypothetical protein E6G30_08235 [Actinobacteria bacterium]|jgi:hypothetical protein|nr:MAG: hypothetical protein E6G30_08235 [Actinomycetota bacterium]
MGYRVAGRVHAAASRAGAAATRAGARLAERARAADGQGTVEYVALILLVAVVLAGVVMATRRTSIGDGGIGRTIVEKLRGALDQVK